MKEKSLRKYSIVNLILGYILTLTFIFLVALNIDKRAEDDITPIETQEVVNETEDANISIQENLYIAKGERYINDIHYKDHLIGRHIPDQDLVIYEKGIRPSRIVEDPIHIETRGIDEALVVDGHNYETIERNINNNHLGGTTRGGLHDFRTRTRHDADDVVGSDREYAVDAGLLDRRLKERDLFEEYQEKDKLEEKIGIDKDGGIDFEKLTIADEEGEGELGDIALDFDDANEGYGVGKGGQLYAYNFPSQGVGAGVGSSAIGAGAGGGAGLGAGIGEGMLNGEIVPTLGGVGDGAKTIFGEPAEPAGVGGLVGGAGAGGAAGLTQGYITEKLGMGIGIGPGAGGGTGAGRGYNYDHLPENGSLHIMIHVDGSGSILSTRRELDEMKDTLLKKALLPYYNNDESLYNKRVTILDDAGERTLQFFTEAAKKDNVLAIAFQDEAAPDYHLPTFNKVPQGIYTYDLNRLKAKLGDHRGVYRGIMFQVDRGRTFSKSFKEMVECAWNGEGYLSKENLKKYHRDENLSNIKNKKGIVFSDEYHAKSEGDPQYYLDLIFKASKRIGIDLNIHAAGLTDGEHVSN